MLVSYHDLLEELLDEVVLLLAEDLHVGEVVDGLVVAVGADVLIDPLRLGLEDADAATVEPVLAALAADVESEVGDR